MSRCVLFLWAAALLAQQDEVRNPRTSPTDVAQGERTFRSHCSPCHGLKGEGGRGPNLAVGIFYHGSTDADLLQNISNGIDGTEMPGMFYSPDRVWQVVAYIRSLNAAPPEVSAATVAAGEALFQGKVCSNCHRVNGVGGRMGPDLSAIGKSRSVDHLRQSILDPNADVRQRYWVVTITDAGGKTVGLNIGLPFEQLPNVFITPELSFEFHYFFMRKFWFAYLAKALVIFPAASGPSTNSLKS